MWLNKMAASSAAIWDADFQCDLQRFVESDNRLLQAKNAEIQRLKGKL